MRGIQLQQQGSDLHQQQQQQRQRKLQDFPHLGVQRVKGLVRQTMSQTEGTDVEDKLYHGPTQNFQCIFKYK